MDEESKLEKRRVCRFGRNTTIWNGAWLYESGLLLFHRLTDGPSFDGRLETSAETEQDRVNRSALQGFMGLEIDSVFQFANKDRSEDEY